MRPGMLLVHDMRVDVAAIVATIDVISLACSASQPRGSRPGSLRTAPSDKPALSPSNPPACTQRHTEKMKDANDDPGEAKVGLAAAALGRMLAGLLVS